jgi:adenine-specific DNA methylase
MKKYNLIECWEFASWGGSDSCSYSENWNHTYFSSFKDAFAKFKELTEAPKKYMLNSSNLVGVLIIDEETNKTLRSWGDY